MANFSELRILNNLDEILEIIKTGDTWPVMVEIDPTNICSHDCIWCCDAVLKSDKRSLTFQQMTTALEELISHNLKSVVIKGGGEPTLSPHFVHLVEWLGERNIAIGVSTAGSNLTDKYDYAISQFCHWVKVSLDAASFEMHQKLHRPIKPHNFDVIITNIERLAKRKKELNSKLSLGISFCINEDNYIEIEQGADLAKKLGCDYIYFKDVVFEKRGNDGAKFRQFGIGEFADDLIADMKKKLLYDDFKVFSLSRPKSALTAKCLFTPLMAVLTARGDVYPCCHTRGREGWQYDNFIQEGSFSKVWLSNRRYELQKKVIRRDCLEYCSYRYEQHNIIFEYLWQVASGEKNDNFI